MKFVCMRAAACLWAALFLASGAWAQELRGRIAGVVTDNSGAVLSGVTITVSSPALIQPQTTTSRPDGSYQFPALPSGVYTAVFSMTGFQTVRREGIRVNLNTTLTIDSQLQLASMAEELSVTAESPVVDITNTNIGTSFTKELLTDIPNARDLWAALSQAPGFQMAGYDVGGSHTGTQTTYTTYGVTGDNKTLLEGINVTESRDANAGYFDYGSFEEFQVGGSGNMGEAAGAGGLLNFTIKSGGDAFHGDVYFDYENDNTISDNVPPALEAPGGVDEDGYRSPATGLSAGNPITKQYDLNVGVGGPIVKKKVWFYASYRNNNQYKTILGLPGEEAQSKLENFTGKLTYSLNSKNNIIAFFNQRTKLQPLRELSLARPVDSAWWQASKNRSMKIEWTSVLTDKLFLDLQVGHWKNDFPLFPTQTASTSVEGVPVGRIDLATNQASGAWSYYHQRITTKPQVSGSLSYAKDRWAGNHNFKVGFEVFRERRSFLRFLPGNIYYRDRAGGPAEVELWNTPNTGINDNKSVSVYLQDGWNLSRRLTVNVGVRYDRYTLGWPAQEISPERGDVFPARSTPDTTVATWNSFGPRLGVAWDLTGKGKTVLKTFYGRYYINPSTNIPEQENPVGAAGIRYRFNDLNGNRVLDPGELGAQITTRGGAGFVRVDRGIKHPYGEELSAHLEHEFVPSMSVRASYVYKNQRLQDDEVDLLRVGAFTVPFAFTDTGADNIRGTADDQVLNLFDRRPGVGADRVWTNPGAGVGTPEEKGDYHTLEFGVNRRFKDKWLLLTSFEHTWAKDLRERTTVTSVLEAVRHVQRFRWNPNERLFGPQAQTFWNFKLVGRYEFPLGIALAASYKLQSGYNYTRVISVPFPVSGSTNVYAEPIENKRAPNVGILDFRVEKVFALGERAGKLSLMVDVFNATNSSVVTNFRTTSGSRYNEVLALLDPRAIRGGIRYSF